MRISSIRLLAAALSALAVQDARAQSASDAAGYSALLFTPVGALPPSTLGPGGAREPTALDLRYGRVDIGGATTIHSFGLSVGAPMGDGRGTFTIGTATCQGCDGSVMAGASLEVPVLATTSGDVTFGLGLEPEVGYRRVFSSAHTNVFSGALSLPLSISTGAPRRAVLFVSPGYGYGRISVTDFSRSGSRPILGAGARIGVMRGVGLTLGMRKIFIEDGDVQFGAGLSFGAQASSGA